MNGQTYEQIKKWMNEETNERMDTEKQMCALLRINI